ncbi:transcriptional regulator [Anopheles sinensis]|uniref:Transcriptional regulator n=1 Tax=Anopheles sinensis TaxID=74873 RepID=A0A084WTC2_ANOSI|nr:transcriptional regulator [Anopheles sinensis]
MARNGLPNCCPAELAQRPSVRAVKELGPFTPKTIEPECHPAREWAWDTFIGQPDPTVGHAGVTEMGHRHREAVKPCTIKASKTPVIKRRTKLWFRLRAHALAATEVTTLGLVVQMGRA